MRKLLLVGAFAAAALLPSAASQAYYDGPWCAVINMGVGVVSENCSMPSFEACRAEASHFGPTSFCRQNGRYPGYWSGAPAQRRVAHRGKHRRHQH